jgi:hypothetical protein
MHALHRSFLRRVQAGRRAACSLPAALTSGEDGAATAAQAASAARAHTAPIALALISNTLRRSGRFVTAVSAVKTRDHRPVGDSTEREGRRRQETTGRKSDPASYRGPNHGLRQRVPVRCVGVGSARAGRDRQTARSPSRPSQQLEPGRNRRDPLRRHPALVSFGGGGSRGEQCGHAGGRERPPGPAGWSGGLGAVRGGRMIARSLFIGL